VSTPYLLNDDAHNDLEKIWKHIAKDKPLSASDFIAEILDCIERLAAMPRMGRERPEFGDGIRSFPHGHYIIFYESRGPRIEVVRIRHGAKQMRDLTDD
jgi:toxin ParE1/3/4